MHSQLIFAAQQQINAQLREAEQRRRYTDLPPLRRSFKLRAPHPLAAWHSRRIATA